MRLDPAALVAISSRASSSNSAFRRDIICSKTSISSVATSFSRSPLLRRLVENNLARTPSTRRLSTPTSATTSKRAASNSRQYSTCTLRCSGFRGWSAPAKVTQRSSTNDPTSASHLLECRKAVTSSSMHSSSAPGASEDMRFRSGRGKRHTSPLNCFRDLP